MPLIFAGRNQWLEIISTQLRHGLRRNAEHHAAFVRLNDFSSQNDFLTSESGVAAALCHRSP
jgi:hypothetical protein